MPTVPERTWCSVPTYDEGQHIGSCGAFLQGDEQTREQLGRALGWRLGPEPLCPGHNRTTNDQDEETNR